MRVLLLVPFVALAASCASSSGAGAPAAKPASTPLGTGSMGSLSVATHTNSDILKMPYSADAVFRILPSIYDSLSIPVTTMTPATRTIGNPSLKLRQRLGRVSLSKYIDCGNSIGPNADSYDVIMSVTTTVTADGPTASTVTTILDAQARPATFNQGYNRCSTKGALELRLTDLVKARLSKP